MPKFTTVGSTVTGPLRQHDPITACRNPGSTRVLFSPPHNHGPQVTDERRVGLLESDRLIHEFTPIAVRLPRGGTRLFEPTGILNPARVL